MPLGGRELKVFLTSDVSKFRSGLNRAERDAKGWGSRMGALGKSAGLALGAGLAAAAAGAAAFAVEGIQTAIADQSSQSKLASAMRDTTKATQEQIDAMEDYVTVAQQRTGLDDGDMRAGLTKLLRATGSSTRAQQLMNSAMKISLGTGKPLTTVIEAMVRAQNGNVKSLQKITGTVGPAAKGYAEYLKQVSAVNRAQQDAKTAMEQYGPASEEYATALQKVRDETAKLQGLKGQGKWVAELNKQFGSAEQDDANTYAGKVRRVASAWGELQEAFGTGVLDSMSEGNDGMGGLADTLYEMQPTAEVLGQHLADIAKSLGDSLSYLGPIVTKLNELNDMGDGILTDGTLTTFFGTIVPGARAAAAALTGNDAALAAAVADSKAGKGQGVEYSERPNGPRQTFTPAQIAAAQALAAARAQAGGAYAEWDTGFDPTRYMTRQNDRQRSADGRSGQRRARTRTSP